MSIKDKAAVALARKRWAGKTAKDKAENSKRMLAGRAKLSAKKKKAIASAAAKARWDAKKPSS